MSNSISDVNSQNQESKSHQDGRVLTENKDYYICNYIKANQEGDSELVDFQCELIDSDNKGVSFKVTFEDPFLVSQGEF